MTGRSVHQYAINTFSRMQKIEYADRRYRLDENPLVLRGAPYSASGVLLRGTVVLCLSEPLRIQGLRLRFIGERRLELVYHAQKDCVY